MKAPRKKTEIRHVRLTQELRAILLPETPAPASLLAFRKVVLIVPGTPECVFTLDHPTPAEAGPNRVYDLPIITPPRTEGIRFMPDQTLYAASKIGLANVTLIVEYLEGDP